jgi:hypothetical protein
MSSRSPSLAAVLDLVLTRRLSDVHTAMPGRVEAFDAARQTANVQLLLKARRSTETGVIVDEPLPVAVNVPVVFPGAGAFRVVFPLKAGDGVLVLFAEASIDRWQALGGLQPTADDRRFHLADAIAIPGLLPDVQSWDGLPSAGMSIGHDTGPGIVLRSSQVELGAREGTPSTEQVVLGTSYRAAEDAAIDSAVSQLAAIAGALTAATAALGSAIALNAVPIVGGALAAAPLGVVAAQMGVIAAQLASAVASLSAFKASASTTLSTVVKTR